MTTQAPHLENGIAAEPAMTGRDDIPALEAARKAVQALGALLSVRPHSRSRDLPDRYLEWVQSVEKVHASIRDELDRASRPSADHEAVRQRAVEDERDRLEAIYRLGVQDACDMIGPPPDMTDVELTQYGRDKRQVVEWARRELLSPSSAWRSVSARAALRKPANEKGGEA